MSIDRDYLYHLQTKKLNCAQIMMQMGLSSLGQDNPLAVKAMSGLGSGLCGCGKTCGALTGAACLISLFAGRGTDDETSDENLSIMIKELVSWFETQYCLSNGNSTCPNVLGNDMNRKFSVCPHIIEETCEKAFSLLAEFGYEVEPA